LHGIYIFASDSTSARDTSFASLGALRDIGITSDADFDRMGAATQSEFTLIVQTMKNRKSNYGQCTSQYACTVNLRKEAALQGLQGVKVWDCSVQCYDKQFLAAGGSDVNGQYVNTQFLPFLSKADRQANKMLANFVKYTGAKKVASFGAYAWAAVIAFRDAVKAVVAENGVNGVTRKAIFAALNNIHSFNAEGMFGTIDLARRKVTACGVTMRVKNNDFVRVNPTKPGTFDCSPKNVILRKLDLIK
jgi:ABC-type branched-subunit amino acid transport system substrate-binding protein